MRAFCQIKNCDGQLDVQANPVQGDLAVCSKCGQQYEIQVEITFMMLNEEETA